MNICVFASGEGSNFNSIVEAVKNGYLTSRVTLLITNNSGCGAVRIAEKNKIETVHISRKIFPALSRTEYSEKFLTAIKKNNVDFIVLAGYMKLIDPAVLKKYKDKIINIHPALLPSFGGKGMFGLNVHRAVISSGVKVSGLTIHFIDDKYDEGKIIFQKCCEVTSEDNEFTLQKKIQKLEHEYYPKVIKLIEDNKI